MRMLRGWRAWCAFAAITSCLGAPGAALSQEEPLGVDETDALVRGVWYEGMPFEKAARIGPAGAAHLGALLADPDETATHANALLALGISGQPGAYEAIEAWATTPRSGEIDRATFRAWQALPHARGHLARHDPRALDALAAQLGAEPDFAWSFGRFDGARLGELARRGAASGLATSGTPRARALLTAQRGRGRAARAQWDAHVAECLELQQRVASEGAAGVFGGPREGVR